MHTKNINQGHEMDEQEQQVEDTLQLQQLMSRKFLERTEVEGDYNTKRQSVAGNRNRSSPPPYRMPPQPLYNEPANIPGSTNFTTPQIHTHSNKFPIEREVILCNSDKNSKIPILNDYHRKIQKSSVAPDAPNVQMAWMDNRANSNCYESRMLNTPGTMMNETIHVYKAKPLPGLINTEGTDPSPILPTNVLQTSRDMRFHSTPEAETSSGNNKTFPSRTYNTIKDMISSRFNKNKIEVVTNGLNNNTNKDTSKHNDTLSPQSQLKQRGVYLGQLRGQSTAENRDTSEWRSPNETANGGEIHYRERGIDVVEHNGGNNRTRIVTTSETPKRTQPCTSKTNACSSNQRLSEFVPSEELGGSIGPSCMYSHRLPSQISSGEQEKRPVTTHRVNKQIPYGMVKEEPDNLIRTRSNDYLVEGNSSKDVKMRSRSFENILNRQEDGPCEIIGGATSDHDRHRHSDSGRGSTVYSSGKINRPTDTSPDSSSEPHRPINNRDTQWTDTVPTELKQILEPDIQDNSTLSDSSASPPLPPEDSSDGVSTPVYKGKSLVFGSKGDRNCAYRGNAVPSTSKGRLWPSRNTPKEKAPHRLVVTKRSETHSKISSTVGSSSLDLDSMLDDNNYTSEEDLSTTDAMAIRKQLEGLENMYSEVLKLLGVRNKSNLGRYQPSDPRISKRRVYGSMSSLPSSVSSRPIRDRYRRYDDRKKTVRDVKGINKRFQRLESHVVTLARSVAHLSSEMRTQHLMIQEMEVIRGELSSLRAQTNALSYRSQSVPRLHVTTSEQTNSSPDKLKKLTKFFGDEPPLLRLFLKKLGYEKYANTFEKERIGLVELPYMSEERLQKLGIPMGPRLRIMQEAQLGFPGAHENTLCIV